MNPHIVIATSVQCRQCDGTGVYAAGSYLHARFIHAGCAVCGNTKNYIDWRPCGRCQQTGNEP
jgi:hypothetical protein